MKIVKVIISVFLLFVFSLMPSHARTSTNQERIVVRKISILHSAPYLKKKLLRLSSLQSGDIFKPEAILETKQRIQDYYEKDGYFNTNVDVTALPDKKPGFINITIDIHKGSHHRIGVIKITGNKAINSKKIKNRIGQQTRFSPIHIKQKLVKLSKKYDQLGYVRNRVKFDEAKLNNDTQRVDIDLSIAERKKLLVTFNGNHWFSNSTLFDQTAFLKEKTYDEESIESSKQSLKLFYQLNGFLNTSIESTFSSNDENVQIEFHIKEGQRTRLKRINLIGLNEMDFEKATDGFKSQTHSLTRQGLYIESPIYDDIKVLESNFHKYGYFDYSLNKIEISFNDYKDQATIDLMINEGTRYKINSLSVDGSTNNHNEIIDKELKIKTNTYYQQSKIQKISEKITKQFQELGYPLVQIKTEELIHPETKSTDIVYHLNTGPRVKIGNILIQGLYYTKESVVREASKLKNGDYFLYDKLLKGQFNLKRMDLFDHVSITPINLTTDSSETDILINLKERKRITADIQAGFDSDKLANGEIILTRRNIFGLGKHLQFKGIGGFELSRGELNLISPRLFGASWNVLNQYFVQFEDDVNFNAFSYGGSLGALKNFSRDLTVLLKCQINRFNLIEEDSNSTALAKNLFDNTFAEILASVSFDTRDNFADPHKGLYSVLSGEIDTDLSHVTNDFAIVKISTSHYLTFGKNITLSNNLRLGAIDVLTSGTRIPATKLFFMGGNDTIRGFKEDAILDSGGTKSLIYNAELTFRLAHSLQLAGFTDVGSLTDSFSSISLDTIRESAGFGLRYITPVGPIRLDYGFIIDRQTSEPMGRLHFTFGSFF